MQASIVLDQPGNVAFTNLDEISGRVVLRCTRSVNISSIVVKLEGESRTRLIGMVSGPRGDEQKVQLEYHKILYKLNMVFPPADVLEGRSQMSGGKSTYTLPAGSHEYPWHFKLPFNNACYGNKGMLPTVGLTSFGIEVARPPTLHVKKTLPPTLSGFPGEAEIRYFVKATVARSGLFKENPRVYTSFNFFPIEPPRQPSTGSQVFARQTHTFTAFPENETNKGKMKSLFGMKSNTVDSQATNDAPSVRLDIRLPEPAILTCNQNLPLKIVVKKLNACSDVVHLQSLQVCLLGYTRLRAHELFRTEQNTWIIMSQSNMGLQIGKQGDPEGTEVVLDDKLWRGSPLPNNVAPSFETCNISRSYQVDVRAVLSYSGKHSSAAKPQTIVLPLRLDTLIYSGIAPPAQVLSRMAEARAEMNGQQTAAVSDKLTTEGRTPGNDPHQPPSYHGSTSAAPPPPLPSRPGEDSSYDDAPPSYEDAIASELPPIDGHRPDYAPPPPREDDVLRRDEKKGWTG